MLLLYGTGVATYPVQNVLFEYRNHAPIQLLTWEAMKQAMDSGACQIDMGPSRIGSNVFAKRILEQRLTLYKISLEIQQKKSFGLVRSTVSVAVLTLMRGLWGQFG